jgi:hypothetical protein
VVALSPRKEQMMSVFGLEKATVLKVVLVAVAALLAALLLVVARPALAASFSFAAAQHYAVGELPQDPIAADFDGKNGPDLATVNFNSFDVGVLLNNGDGTFAAAVNYAVGGLSLSIAPADFNGDGDADLAVANFFTDNVSVLLNNGDGTFPATPQNFAVGGVQPISIAPADFNGDGKIDLAVVGQGTNPKNTNVSALINTSTATAVDFEASQNVVTGTTPVGGVIGSVRSADFNGDTRPDLAVANGHIPDATDTVSVLLNNYGSDTTAPMLNLPGNITEEATEPTGATVSYTATATDDTDPNMPVDCSPVSGSTFTIGTTTVECTATDSSGNTASGSFTVTVKGATDQLSDIKELVASLPGLPAGTNTSLQAKLNDTLSAANGGDTASACTALKDFISQVRAQQGKKKISAQDAAKLISEAQRIQAVLGC